VGTFEGLFYDSSTNDLEPASSGFVSAQVQGTGAFTAKFLQGGKTYSVGGQLSLTGAWSTAALKTWNKTAISLQFDLSHGDSLTGDLSNTGWTAQVQAYRNVFSKANPAPQAGHYTLVLPGGDSSAQPEGNGSGSVTVNTNTGGIAFSGTLGDGTAVTETANESPLGYWPVYISLDSGNGMLLGWLAFTNAAAGPEIDGTLNWFKPSKPVTAVYPAGFTNQVEVVSSAYSLPKGARVLELTNGYALLENGGLTESISNQFFLAANNSVTGSNKLHLTLTTTTGLFKGTTTNALGKTVSFSGAVLQNQTNGFGEFINGAQTGSVFIAPR
jgi:hypothetical protein